MRLLNMGPYTWGPQPATYVNHYTMQAAQVISGDWPTSAAATGSTLPRYVEFRTESTVFINLQANTATVQSSGTNVTDGSGNQVCTQPYPLVRQIPGGSTGFSLAAVTSGRVQMSVWA